VSPDRDLAGKVAVADENVLRVNSVAINFVTTEDVKMLREIEQFYNTEISEMVSRNAVQDSQRTIQLTSKPLYAAPQRCRPHLSWSTAVSQTPTKSHILFADPLSISSSLFIHSG